MTMYIEMIDETNQVSEEIKNQTLDILEFAAQKQGKKTKKWRLLLWPMSVAMNWISSIVILIVLLMLSSLEYKPESSLSFDEEDLSDDPDLAEVLTEFDAYIGELFISVDKAREQAQEYGHSFEREMGFLAVHGFLHINGYDHYTPQEEKEMFSLQEEILDAYGLKR